MAADTLLTFPVLRPVGLDGLLISFSDKLEDAANRAALALADDLRSTPPDGMTEVTMSLASVLVRFDPLEVALDALEAALRDRLARQDWYAAPLPQGRKLWRVPTIYGTDLAPQLAETAELAGCSEDQAIAELSATAVRVQAIGFAPGQPYLGQLGTAWNIPRQKALTPRVPKGALVLAIRQFVIFAVTAPTGWRHVAQTAFPLFDPARDPATLLRTGDEVMFDPAPRKDWDRLQADRLGGAMAEDIA